jgi:type II secretory pathway component PulM
MNVFGVEVGLLEFLALFSFVLVIYLIFLEYEFRHIKRITRRFDEEEFQLNRIMRELKNEVSELRGTMGPGVRTGEEAGTRKR